jgi:hypothetical protein
VRDELAAEGRKVVLQGHGWIVPRRSSIFRKF